MIKHNVNLFFSLEYLGIVQVGENIGSIQNRATHPKGSNQNIFLKFNNNYNEWFDSLVSW